MKIRRRRRRNPRCENTPFDNLQNMTSPTCEELGIPYQSLQLDLESGKEFTETEQIITSLQPVSAETNYLCAEPELCNGISSCDPFSPECMIPLPHPFGEYPRNGIANIRRRNERERERVRCVNNGYAVLRRHLPLEDKDKRISKVETLKSAIRYIQFLQNLLSESNEATMDFSRENFSHNSNIFEEEISS